MDRDGVAVRILEDKRESHRCLKGGHEHRPAALLQAGMERCGIIHVQRQRHAQSKGTSVQVHPEERLAQSEGDGIGRKHHHPADALGGRRVFEASAC